MVLHSDIQQALLSAAVARHSDTLRRKETENEKLGAHEYQELQRHLNEQKFLSPTDAHTTKANIYYIRIRFSKFCREKNHGNWKEVISPRRCSKGLIMTFLFWICETYLRPRRKRSKKKTVNQYWRDFKMLYRRYNDGQEINRNHCGEIIKYINGSLKEKFDLDDQPASKPVMGVDDLLLGLTQHWSRDRSIFPTEDDRLDLATIMLFQAYTACRPAELVDGTKRRGTGDPLLDEEDDDNAPEPIFEIGRKRISKLQKLADRRKVPVERRSLSGKGGEMDSSSGSESHDSVFDSGEPYDTDATSGSDDSDDELLSKKSRKLRIGNLASERDSPVAKSDEEQTRRHKAICYEDIVLWIVKDVKHGGRDMLAMEVFLRHHKGADRKPKPTIFLFRENPLPILCPISHVLARAIRDDAIEVDGYSQAKPFFSTQIGKKATKVHWKSSVLHMPLFRRSTRVASGGWIKSFTDPMKYSTYAFYLNRIGWDLGSEDKWTTYCLRRGNANALLGMAPDAVVDQVMRHDPMTGCLANAYLNQRVGFNTQDAYLERDPTADGLTKAFTHMSLRCNPEVPKEIPAAELNKLPPDPDAVELAKEIKLESARLRQLYGFIKLAPKKERESYKELQDERRSVEKIFKTHMTKVYQEVCRRRMHNEELEKQLRGERSEDAGEPTVEHHLEERTKLQTILCDFRIELSAQELVDRKVQAIDTMVLLASRREVRPTLSQTPIAGGSRAPTPTLEEESQPEPIADIPLVLGKTQCIYCVGNEQLPLGDRMRSFKRVSHMMDHVENLHLRFETGGPKYLCRHPKCRHLGDFLTSLNHFKNHVQTVHGIKLR